MPKPVAKRRERVLIWIKDINDISLLPICSAVQAYAKDAKRKHQGFCSLQGAISDYAVAIDLVLPKDTDEFASVLLTLVPEILSITNDFDAMPHSRYDAIFDLCEEDARAIGLATGKHLAQAYGIVLGSEASSLPDLIQNLCPAYTPSNKVLTSSHWPIIKAALDALPLEGNNELALLQTQAPLKDRIAMIFQCKGVIAESCFETYLAACLKKPVIEINTDDATTKWSSPYYHRMITLSREGLDRGLRLCFPELLER